MKIQCAGDEGRMILHALPRIGLYSPWRGNMDEGWTRYVFDTFGIPYRVATWRL